MVSHCPSPSWPHLNRSRRQYPLTSSAKLSSTHWPFRHSAWCSSRTSPWQPLLVKRAKPWTPSPSPLAERLQLHIRNQAKKVAYSTGLWRCPPLIMMSCALMPPVITEQGSATSDSGLESLSKRQQLMPASTFMVYSRPSNTSSTFLRADRRSKKLRDLAACNFINSEIWSSPSSGNFLPSCLSITELTFPLHNAVPPHNSPF